MIEVQGLTKRYGELTALDNVSFSVKKGQILGFLGANGAGKTTTMEILCGCIGADSGTAKIAGFDIAEDPVKAKACIGYLPDEPPLYVDMKVQDYILHAARLHGIASGSRKRAVDDVIEKLSLGNVRNRLIENLSKGFKQRVGLAQAIVHNPEVLIMDEPTEGLDPNQIVQIRDMIKSLAGDHTILLSSHILSEVQNTCDHLVIIHEGKIVEQGTYDELVSFAESGANYNLKVKNNHGALVNDLGSMDGIVEVSFIEETKEILFQLDGEKANPELVLKKVMDGNHAFEEMSLVKRSLEDVFVNLTT